MAMLVTVDEALAAGTPLLALKARALRAIGSLVPASLLVFATLTRRSTLRDAVALQTEPLALELTDMWDRYLLAGAASVPFLTAALPAGAVAVLAELTADDTYTSFLAHCGIGDCAAIYLQRSGTAAAVIGLARSTRRPAFSYRDTVERRTGDPLRRLLRRTTWRGASRSPATLGRARAPGHGPAASRCRDREIKR